MKRAHHYIIDTEGQLWHEGEQFEDEELLTFFFKNLQPLKNGDFEVFCQGEHCIFTPQDVPYVVQQIEVAKDSIQLIFPGNYREILDPSTLEVGKENILYCKVREGKMKARFNRKTYYEISKFVEEDKNKNIFHLLLNEKKYPISY